jgi:penicillin-binding protein 1A
LFYWVFVLGLWGVIGLTGLVAYEASQLPAIQNLAIPERPPTVIIQGQDGKTIAARGDMRGSAVPLRALPPYLPQAFIAIEDRRFYSHFGIDLLGLARAVVVNLTSGRLREGGSTLTQQLAKNLFLTQERTLSRKIQEVILALWLETKYSKNEIVELYVNRVYFGAGAYGVEAAAQRYFGKSARQVTLSVLARPDAQPEGCAGACRAGDRGDAGCRLHHPGHGGDRHHPPGGAVEEPGPGDRRLCCRLDHGAA